jgi:hypothetical protein
MRSAIPSISGRQRGEEKEREGQQQYQRERERGREGGRESKVCLSSNTLSQPFTDTDSPKDCCLLPAVSHVSQPQFLQTQVIVILIN